MSYSGFFLLHSPYPQSNDFTIIHFVCEFIKNQEISAVISVAPEIHVFLYDFHSHKQPKMVGAMISIQENKSHKVFLALAHVLKRSCGKFVKTSSLHIK